MKKVLFITPYNPLEHPLGAASQSVAYRLLHLAEMANVEVVTFSTNRMTMHTVAWPINVRMHLLPYPSHDTQSSSPAKRIHQVLSGRLELFNRMKTLASTLGNTIISLVERHSFNLVHIDDVTIHEVAVYCPPSLKKLFFFHNLMTLQYKNLYRSRRTFPRKMLAFFEYLHIRRLETKALSTMGTVVVLTRQEEEIVRALSPRTTVFRIPLEVDPQLYYPDHGATKSYQVVFTGTMSYEPNHEGAIFFIKEILPHILRECPHVRFFVVGKNPPADLLAFGGKNVTVTGPVPSIIEYIKEASVIVVPLLTGGGMRFKILEAFAMGKAVVSTTVGAEGIEYEDGTNILIADDPVAFARHVVTVLKNPQMAEALGNAARYLVERHYATSVVGRQWQDLYRTLWDTY